MMRRILPWRGSWISLMNCSSGGTTMPGWRKLDRNTSTFFEASTTSSSVARYQPPALFATGHVARTSVNSSCGTSDHSNGSISTEVIVPPLRVLGGEEHHAHGHDTEDQDD